MRDALGLGLVYIGVLALLEGLLSADNALVLAVMVRHLPAKEQRRVLRYGIWGAIGFRFIAVLCSSILLRFWYCKVAGGVYLLYLAVKHFFWESGSPSAPQPGDNVPGARSARPGQGFWATVTSATLADIAFSIDSILAAVAMAESFPFGDNAKLFIVYVGGVLGIITMRFVVRYFVLLLERFPGLAEGAYYLVAWIGLKLLINGFHDAKYTSYHVPEWLFWVVMALIALASLLVRPAAERRIESDLAASLDLLETEGENSGEGESP
jgi:YkoY family integral membrane protein